MCALKACIKGKEKGFCCVNFAYLALGMQHHSQSLYSAVVSCCFCFCCCLTCNAFSAAQCTNLEHVLMLAYMQFSPWRYIFRSLSAKMHSQLHTPLSHNGMLINLHHQTPCCTVLFLGCQLWFQLSAAAMLLPTSRRLKCVHMYIHTCVGK